MLSNREARRLDSEARSLEYRIRQLRQYGISREERYSIERQIARLSSGSQSGDRRQPSLRRKPLRRQSYGDNRYNANNGNGYTPMTAIATAATTVTRMIGALTTTKPSVMTLVRLRKGRLRHRGRPFRLTLRRAGRYSAQRGPCGRLCHSRDHRSPSWPSRHSCPFTHARKCGR
jgi:hypothetical protein